MYEPTNKAPANAARIRQPPDNDSVEACCISSENCKPDKILAARLSAEYTPI